MSDTLILQNWPGLAEAAIEGEYTLIRCVLSFIFSIDRNTENSLIKIYSFDSSETYFDVIQNYFFRSLSSINFILSSLR